MKKVILLIALLSTLTLADNSGLEGRVTTLEGLHSGSSEPTTQTTITTSETELFNQSNELYKSLLSSNAALSSVELNPDHTGWSASIGLSNYGSKTAGALGIMYALPTDENGVTLGINIKTFTVQDGSSGASTGLTLGF